MTKVKINLLEIKKDIKGYAEKAPIIILQKLLEKLITIILIPNNYYLMILSMILLRKFWKQEILITYFLKK